MKGNRIRFSVFILFLGVTRQTFAETNSAVSQPQTKVESKWGPQQKGLQAQITLRKKVFGEYEPIDLEHTFKNVSTQKIPWDCKLGCFQIIVKDQQGHQIKLTSQGRSLQDSTLTANQKKWPLAPLKTSEAQMELRELIELEKPGDYTVQLFYNKVPSNLLLFTIQKDEKMNIGEKQASLGEISKFCPKEPVTKSQCQAIATLYSKAQKDPPFRYWTWSKGLNICSFSGITCANQRVSINLSYGIAADLLVEFTQNWPTQTPIEIISDHQSCLEYSSMQQNIHKHPPAKKILCSFSD